MGSLRAATQDPLRTQCLHQLIAMVAHASQVSQVSRVGRVSWHRYRVARRWSPAKNAPKGAQSRGARRRQPFVLEADLPSDLYLAAKPTAASHVGRANETQRVASLWNSAAKINGRLVGPIEPIILIRPNGMEPSRVRCRTQLDQL